MFKLESQLLILVTLNFCFHYLYKRQNRERFLTFFRKLLNRMEEQKNQKLSLKKILVFLNNFLKQVGVFWDKYKSKSWYMIPVAVLTIFYAIFLGYKIYVRVLDLESRNYSLKDLLNYNITTLKLNSVTKKDVNLMKTIDEIIIYDQEIRGESLRYKSYLEDLQVPYTYLMKNIFLPSLNIWKDPYL